MSKNKMTFRYNQDLKMLEKQEILLFEKKIEEVKQLGIMAAIATPVIALYEFVKEQGYGVITKIAEVLNYLGLDGYKFAITVNQYLDKAGLEVVEDLFIES